MTSAQFKARLRNDGFSEVGSHFTRQVGSQLQHVAQDNVRGSAWRLFLAVGTVPEQWPAYVEPGDWLEAESPWFNYFNDLDPNDPADDQFDDKGGALMKCHEWLSSTGVQWLSDPFAKSADLWRMDHNVLVKHWPK